MLGGGDWEGGICLDSATDRALTHEMDRMRHSRLISKTQQQSRLMLANETDQRLHDGAWIPLPKSQLSCTRFHLTSPLRLDGDKAHASGPRPGGQRLLPKVCTRPASQPITPGRCSLCSLLSSSNLVALGVKDKRNRLPDTHASIHKRRLPRPGVTPSRRPVFTL